MAQLELNQLKFSSMMINGLFYIVATPIGNLSDITLRALEVLKKVDIILCEDTRVTRVLLNKYGINKTVRAYNDHSDEKARKTITEEIKLGKSIALVSDAGTPLISDPGYKLICNLRELDIKIETIPGACSAIAALTLSGLPSDKFLFLGFLPTKSKARLEIFDEYKSIKATLICFESPNRLVDTLEDLEAILKDSKISVSREITKLFEETITGSPAKVKEYYIQNPDRLKGEIVICIESNWQEYDSIDLIAKELEKLMERKSLRDAVEIVASQYKIPKKQVYKLALDSKMI